MRQTARQLAKKEEQLAAAVKYVRKRNGVFQYERRVPERVKREAAHYAVHFGSKPLFRRSLRTKNELEMHAACIAVHTEFERKVASVSTPIEPNFGASSELGQRTRRAVTQADLEDLSERYRALTVAPFEQAHIMADTDANHAEEYERILHEIGLQAEDATKSLNKRGVDDDDRYHTPAEIAAWVIGKDGFDAPAGSVAFGAITGAIRSGIQRGRDEMQALIDGNAVPRFPTAPNDTDVTMHTLGKAVDEYLAHKKLPLRTETEVKSSLRLFVEVIGDKRLDALTRRDFQIFAEYLSKQTIGGKTPGSIVRPASRATLKKRIALLRAVINHAIHRDNFKGPNPASGINIDAYVARPNPSVMPKKRRFTVDEMNLIFQHPWFTGCASPTQSHRKGDHRLTGSEYWVPVVAAYTGCRASELGGLLLTEVILDSRSPHFVIRDNKWRRTKKGAARKVPLLDALIELGFAEYVARIRATGAERLFPDWEPPSGKETSRNDDKQWSNGRVIRAFNRTVIRQMLGDRLSPDARLEATFHGFRGAFKAMLGNNEYKLHPNIIHEVAGHEKDGMDAIYVGEIPIEETYPAVRACRYKGLVIPHLPY